MPPIEMGVRLDSAGEDTGGTLGRWPHFCVTLLLAAAACALIAPAASPLADMLAYDRAALAGGHWYCLLTCHLTHWSLDHLVWDVLAFLALGLVCAARMPRRFLVCLAASALAIPAAVYALLPSMQTYRGLSGLDSALFALLAAALLRDNILARQWLQSAMITALFLAFAAKLLIEFATTRTIFVNPVAATFIPVPLAHLVGAAVGIMVAIPPLFGEDARQRQAKD